MMKDPEEQDVDFEPEDELGTAGAAKAKVQKLREELEKVKTERQEYLDGWQRSKADAINAKREAALANERIASRIKEEIIADIIPALDSFDLAAANPAWETVSAEWRSGMEQIRNQLMGVLSLNGIERFGTAGDQYSPHLHDVVHELVAVEGAPGAVLQVLRYGYKSGDKVIRPAQVVIKKHGEL